MRLFQVFFLLVLKCGVAGAASPCKAVETIGDGSAKIVTISSQRLEDVQSSIEFEGKYFYSIGAIYGKPRIGVVDCSGGKAKVLVFASNKSKAYPDGADYFLIERISKAARGRFEIRYYHAPDVDSVTENQLRSKKYLKKILYP